MAKEWNLKERSMLFALDVARFCQTFPPTLEGWHVRGQLFRSATGTAANYRAVCRSKTDPDLIAKFGVVIEEADETAFWLEFSTRCGLIKPGDERALHAEANELVAIFMQGRKTARKRLASSSER